MTYDVDGDSVVEWADPKGKTIVDQAHVTITNKVINVDINTAQIQSMLHFHPANRNNHGEYTCKADENNVLAKTHLIVECKLFCTA